MFVTTPRPRAWATAYKLSQINETESSIMSRNALYNIELQTNVV